MDMWLGGVGGGGGTKCESRVIVNVGGFAPQHPRQAFFKKKLDQTKRSAVFCEHRNAMCS